MKLQPAAQETVRYRCPYEGAECRLGKHCHIIETKEALPCRITALIKCEACKGMISVEIGA